MSVWLKYRVLVEQISAGGGHNQFISKTGPSTATLNGYGIVLQVKLEIFSEKENVDQLDWAMESLKVCSVVVTSQRSTTINIITSKAWHF